MLSKGEGGGIASHLGTLTLTNSTISGNAALSGGGVFTTNSQLSIIFCTIYKNAAQDGGGIAVGDKKQKHEIRNSIVAENYAKIKGPDMFGTFTSLGYNLIQDVSEATLINPPGQHSTDLLLINFANLKIEPTLDNNGGPTQTYALLPGSPAIDKIPLRMCHIDGISTDQRGIIRPQGATCDIGAYEYVPLK